MVTTGRRPRRCQIETVERGIRTCLARDLAPERSTCSRKRWLKARHVAGTAGLATLPEGSCAQGQPLGQGLQLMTIPAAAEPLTVHVPVQDCRQSHEIAPAPQVLGAQSATGNPLAMARHSSPASQLVVVVPLLQTMVLHAATLTAQAPFVQAATVRPAPAQSS